MSLLEKISAAVIEGNAEVTEAAVKESMSQNIPVGQILNEGLLAGMTVVGRRFKNNECFMPEVLVSAKAMTIGLEILKPKLAESNVKPLGKVVIGTIQGDLHDIGKNIVAMLMQGAGFEVVDLGADVPVERFIETARDEKADLVGISALLTTTMVNMKSVVNGLKGAGIRERVKVIVGGAPVTAKYAADIDADGYAPDAATGVDVAKTLLSI